MSNLRDRETVVGLIKAAQENGLPLFKGDVVGHEFHGNQHTGRGGNSKYTFSWRGDVVNETHEGGGHSKSELVAINVLDDMQSYIEDYTDLEGISRVSGVVYDSFNELARDIISDHYTDSTGKKDAAAASRVADSVLEIFDFDKGMRQYKSSVGTKGYKGSRAPLLAMKAGKK